MFQVSGVGRVAVAAMVVVVAAVVVGLLGVVAVVGEPVKLAVAVEGPMVRANPEIGKTRSSSNETFPMSISPRLPQKNERGFHSV